MSLEEEAEKTRPPEPRRVPRAPSGVDRVVRLVAFALLVAALAVTYWVPFSLVGSGGAAVVMALVTIWLASLASRVHELRRRIESLESTDASAPGPPEAPDQK